MVWILETIDILYNILRNGETSYTYIYIYICPTTNCSHLQTITLFIVDNVNNIHTCVCVCVCVQVNTGYVLRLLSLSSPELYSRLLSR